MFVKKHFLSICFDLKNTLDVNSFSVGEVVRTLELVKEIKTNIL